ncbi:MAG: nucleotidyltransferase [Eubacteriales bacterium]|nr:nucleotidyltransferase [Eubacteriales bacterium]
MKACGIVAEYNPLHTGHVYQMNKARQISKADCIIVVMSGNFVQRGEPAVIDKYARTRAALKAGADIVVELPVFYALSSAENFAKGAVLTLSKMKASSICFGAETDNTDSLSQISQTIVSESPEYKAVLNKALAGGLSYPAARQTALLEYLPECKDIIAGSNNILAIEYIKAILGNNLNMAYYPVLREGAGYNDDTDNAEYASAFGIRKMLVSDEFDKLKKYVTSDMYEEISHSQNCPLFIDDFSSIFNHKMLFLKQKCNINHTDFAEKLAEYEDITPDLANRFAAAFTGRETITEYAMKVKSKNIVYSRICRCIMHIILEIRKPMSDLYNNIPYIRLLGFNKTGQQYLGSIKKELDVPFITKAADYKNELSFDLACSDIYAQAVYEKSGHVMKNELQQNIIRI